MHFHAVHEPKVAERSMISAEIDPGDVEKTEDREMEIDDVRMIETAAVPWFVGDYSCVVRVLCLELSHVMSNVNKLSI